MSDRIIRTKELIQNSGSTRARMPWKRQPDSNFPKPIKSDDQVAGSSEREADAMLRCWSQLAVFLNGRVATSYKENSKLYLNYKPGEGPKHSPYDSFFYLSLPLDSR